MAFTYTDGGTSNRNRVRLEIGDTDAATAMFTDAEIDDLLSQEGDNMLKAAARACEVLAARYSRRVDFTADGATIRAAQYAEAWRRAGVELRRRAEGTATVTTKRVDGYSDDVETDDVDTVSSSMRQYG